MRARAAHTCAQQLSGFVLRACAKKLFARAGKLLYMLSMPADPDSSTIAEQVRHLQAYKASVLDSDIVAVFVMLLTDVLSKDPGSRRK